MSWLRPDGRRRTKKYIPPSLPFPPLSPPVCKFVLPGLRDHDRAYLLLFMSKWRTNYRTTENERALRSCRRVQARAVPPCQNLGPHLTTSLSSRRSPLSAQSPPPPPPPTHKHVTNLGSPPLLFSSPAFGFIVTLSPPQHCRVKSLEQNMMTILALRANEQPAERHARHEKINK